MAPAEAKVTDDLDLVFHFRNEINPETGEDDFVVEDYKVLNRDLFHANPDKIIGRYTSDFIPRPICNQIRQSMGDVLRNGHAVTEIIQWSQALEKPSAFIFDEEEVQWVKHHIVSLGGNRILVLVKNETPQMRRDLLYDSRARTLEKLAAGKTLKEVLEVLALTTEENFPGMMCAISLYDKDSQLLKSKAAPNLPEALLEKMIEGIPVAPGIGACGQAAATGKVVISENIETDSNWDGHRDLAREFGLASVWAFPVFSKDSEVLGTFSLYCPVPSSPSEESCEIIRECAHIAGIAISHSVAEYKTLLALEEARQANKAKTEFLANMSHELRTPLNAILGFSEVMSEQLFGGLSEKYRDYAEKIHKSGTLLLSLISDLLDVSRIEQGKFKIEKEPIDVEEMIVSTLSVVEEWASEAGILLNHRTGGKTCQLQADKRAMQQVLLNLVSNAIKFTGAGGEVTVTCSDCSANKISLIVSDTGIGIPEEQIVKITKPFQQVGNIYSRTYQGVGLGLYIVNEIVKLHDGVLEIESVPGQGTTVRVILPL